MELKNVSEYEGRKIKWNEIKLPYIPEKFQYKIKNDNGIKKQFKILKNLINSENVDGIYNCGDNDSEGQILIDEILMASKNNKITYRMILPDQTEKTVLSEIDRKALNSEYINFANEGFARQRLDWIYGINTTLLLSVKSGILLNCGRLIAPIVKKIYDVDISIKHFIPTTYYQCESDINGIKLAVSDKFNNSSLAEKLADELNKEKSFVKDITSKDTHKKPSKLFSLTSLQKYMNKNYKMKADEVLAICQSLYEKKYQTYPRTDSEYMSEQEKEKVKDIIIELNDSNLEFKDKKTVFDNTKVEAHSALTPTTNIPTDLNDKERLVYNTVCNRFKANFCKEECIISTSEMIIECGSNEFKFKGEIMKQKGFTTYEPILNLKVLPKLNKGDVINHEFKAVEKQTQPPKKMTQDKLLSYLENPFRSYEEDEEIEVKELGLGTPGTRSEIIKKCCMKYIEDKNNILSITDLGIKFIETINKLGINLYAEKTINLSKNLKSVRNGKITLKDCLNNAQKELIA
ncbi:DNA topoisomerase, partial [Clostridium botulinum]|uniref:DNA topoisomerase n=1 Tax=Clostridium botulinum TaxID=1491 RepID=UPI00067E3C11